MAEKPAPCIACLQPKTATACEVCHGPLCKECVQRQAHGAFSFLKKVPADLAHTQYCPTCYAEKVEPVRDSYAEAMKNAEQVFVFYKTQRKEIPLVKASKEIFRVEECTDRDETILRLAFFAAEQGFNAIVETDVVSDKIRMGAYQTSKWRGTASPASIDEAKLTRQYERNQMYER